MVCLKLSAHWRLQWTRRRLNPPHACILRDSVCPMEFRVCLLRCYTEPEQLRAEHNVCDVRQTTASSNSVAACMNSQDAGLHIAADMMHAGDMIAQRAPGGFNTSMSLANALLPVTRRKRRLRTPLRCVAAAGRSACWARRPASSGRLSRREAAVAGADACGADAEAVGGWHADSVRCSLLVATLASSAKKSTVQSTKTWTHQM